MFLLDVLSQTFLQGTGSTTTPAKCSRGNSHSQDWNNCFTCFRNHILMKNINLKHDDWIQTMLLLEYEMVHSKITTPRYLIMFWMSLAAAKSPAPRTMYHISSKVHTCCVYLITTHTVSYFDRRGEKKNLWHSPIPLVWLKSPLTILHERPSPLQTPQRSSLAEEPMMPSQPIFWAVKKTRKSKCSWVAIWAHTFPDMPSFQGQIH